MKGTEHESAKQPVGQDCKLLNFRIFLSTRVRKERTKCCIRARESWVTKHISRKHSGRLFVDAAGLGGRRAEHVSVRSQDCGQALPGEILE